jgi:choline dehydrogenase-like flavoprotein
MAAAAKRIQDIANTPPLSDWISEPIAPPELSSTIDDLETFTLANVVQADHPLGTALMGPREDGGVVDANLKVYGTTNLYVIDASVIPVMPAAHLQVRVLMRFGQLFPLKYIYPGNRICSRRARSGTSPTLI